MHGIAARTPGHKYTGKWPQNAETDSKNLVDSDLNLLHAQHLLISSVLCSALQFKVTVNAMQSTRLLPADCGVGRAGLLVLAGQLYTTESVVNNDVVNEYLLASLTKPSCTGSGDCNHK